MNPRLARDVFRASERARAALLRVRDALAQAGEPDISDATLAVILHVERMFLLPAAALVREVDGAWPDTMELPEMELEAARAESRQALPDGSAFEVAMSVTRSLSPRFSPRGGAGALGIPPGPATGPPPPPGFVGGDDH